MNQTAVAREFCNKVKEARFFVVFKVKSSVQVAGFLSVLRISTKIFNLKGIGKRINGVLLQRAVLVIFFCSAIT